MSNNDPELDKVHCTLIGEQGKAYLLENEDGGRAFFPKSQVSFVTCNSKTGKAVAEMPIWLLDSKGW